MVLKDFIEKRLIFNTLQMSFGLGARVAFQVVVFYIAARVLGAQEFGLFSAVQALVFLCLPFASWGSGHILIKHASRKSRQFPVLWGTSITLTILASTAFIPLLFLVVTWLYSLHTAVWVVVPLAIGDLLGLALVTISSQAFQSHERFFYTTMTWVVLSGIRLVFSLLFWVLPLEKSVENWSLLYGISGLLSGVLTVAWVNLTLGPGAITLMGMKNEWAQGFYFSVSVSAQGVYNNIDKTLLSKLVSDAAAGVYSVAYRVLDAVFIPVQGLIFAVFPRFFKEGQTSLASAKHLAFRLLPWAVGWGVLAWLGVSVLSPLLPLLFGDDYLQTPEILVFLGPILAFRAAHYLAANALTGADLQSLRSAAQICIAFINFVLNVWWIPIFGWAGAIWSSLISDGLLAAVLWGMVVWLDRYPKPATL